MTKVMLVEDDKSLREIYGVRLLAEGYDIVSAGDGEEALAMAIKERPQLIVSDVMMPKISGFDMLDILRSTTETKNIKVIMMTALSSEEQRQRGETLGADRYLVKSQVGIEDVVRVVHEVLEDQAAPEAPAPAAPAAVPSPTPTPSAVPATPPTAPASATPSAPPSIVVPPRPAASTSTPAPAPAAAAPRPTPPPAPAKPAETPRPASIKTRVIQPINNPASSGPNIGELLDREIAKEAGIDADAIPTVQTAEQERNALEQELAQFQAQPDSTPNTGVQNPDSSGVTIDENGNMSTPGQQGSQLPPPPPPPPVAPTA